MNNNNYYYYHHHSCYYYSKNNFVIKEIVDNNLVGDTSTIELRVQAIKTVGLIGVVDVTVFQQHLINHTGIIDAFSSQLDYVEDLENEGKKNYRF